MTIKIETTIDVDPDAWAAEFGLEGVTRQEIKQDIQTYFAGTVQEQLDVLGLAVKS
jgi:hypothetical protein